MEHWRLVVGFEDFYEVSDLGRIRSLRQRKEMRLNPVGGGYLAVELNVGGKRKSKKIHNLVLEAFVGPKPTSKHQGCHNDGNVSNNKLSNLRYDTQKGNFSDKLRHGTHCRGQQNPNAKLTDLQVLEIRSIGRSKTCKELAVIYNVSDATISDVVRGKRFITTELQSI